jgi:uncharacterized membrane protein
MTKQTIPQRQNMTAHSPSFWYNSYVILVVKNVYKVNDLRKTSYFRETANKLTIYMFSVVSFAFILFQHILNTCMTTSSYLEGRFGSYFNQSSIILQLNCESRKEKGRKCEYRIQKKIVSILQ